MRHVAFASNVCRSTWKRMASRRSRHTRRGRWLRALAGGSGGGSGGDKGADKKEGDQGAARPCRQNPGQLHRTAKQAPCQSRPVVAGPRAATDPPSREQACKRVETLSDAISKRESSTTHISALLIVTTRGECSQNASTLYAVVIAPLFTPRTCTYDPAARNFDSISAAPVTTPSERSRIH